MMTELEELRILCADADPTLEAALADARGALTQLAALQATVARIQREARDVEFEPVAPAIRAAIDGNLLQRAGYVATRSEEAVKRVRECAQGIRDLRAACQQLVMLAGEVRS